MPARLCHVRPWGDHPIRTFCGAPACAVAACTADHTGDALVTGLALIAWLQQISPSPTLRDDGTGPTAFIVVDGDTIRSPVGVKYRSSG